VLVSRSMSGLAHKLPKFSLWAFGSYRDVMGPLRRGIDRDLDKYRLVHPRGIADNYCHGTMQGE
jgi:hypothetical protein